MLRPGQELSKSWWAWLKLSRCPATEQISLVTGWLDYTSYYICGHNNCQVPKMPKPAPFGNPHRLAVLAITQGQRLVWGSHPRSAIEIPQV